MPPRQLNRRIPRRFWHRSFKPQARPPIILKVVISPVSLGSRNSALKDLLGYSMGDLRAMQRRKPNPRLCSHMPMGLRGVIVRQVQANHKAGVHVGAQYRPRSLITVSTAGRILSPNIAFARAAKSGHSTGFSFGRSGTMRPITRSRSRNSTVLPALSQAFSRRVSRNCRMFIVGMTSM